LNGDMVIYLTGLSVCGNAAGSAPDVLVGLLTGDGNGALSMSADQNCGGSRISSTGLFGTYSVAGSGRTSITAGTASAVAYLVSSNTAFIVADGGAVLFGFGEPQTAGSFSNSTLKGTYAGLATTPATFDVVVFSGEFAADGASPTGDMTGAEDIGAPSGPLSDVAFKATYSVASSPTDGRGAMTVTSGTGGSAVIYMISASKFVAASLSDQNPSVLIFELSSPPPPPPTVSLSSLALNPTSVTGGNSSKGIVTLSGPAPGGGALVMLSSSSTAAKAPTSVTVVAGATTATFTVNTSAVTASTTATISASYAGVTETASLTVTPAPPPPPAPTLSSLTLNPSSVIGGVQSSTGQVTLTAPAPAGGATVMLSASNGAARVPSSVFVPAGATSATFTVNTSIVLLSTSVTISASYNGTTRRATLSVLL
jgi:hypothetical protein